ncbi:MAG TPA: type II toxin-antitoxin system VapC family toxin [Puia sp.]|nr:type II toxin-antitoxin system VapC family toxin [Puia sp.]
MAASKSTPMIGNKFLLDTNIVSALLKGETIIADKIDKAEATYIPIIVVGELYYGASFSSQIEKKTADLKLITSRYQTLSLDEETTIVYGNIKTALRKKGKPIPENDIWIAAIALQNDLPLVTRDNHFKETESLTLVAW